MFRLLSHRHQTLLLAYMITSFLCLKEFWIFSYIISWYFFVWYGSCKRF